MGKTNVVSNCGTTNGSPLLYAIMFCLSAALTMFPLCHNSILTHGCLQTGLSYGYTGRDENLQYELIENHDGRTYVVTFGCRLCCWRCGGCSVVGHDVS